MGQPWARFDDLRTGTALRCPAPSEILTATRPDEVADPVDDLDGADQLAVLSSLRGWRRARLLDGRPDAHAVPVESTAVSSS